MLEPNDGVPSSRCQPVFMLCQNSIQEPFQKLGLGAMGFKKIEWGVFGDVSLSNCGKVGTILHACYTENVPLVMFEAKAQGLPILYRSLSLFDYGIDRRSGWGGASSGIQYPGA